MIQKDGLIEDITAVLQCLFNKQKECPEIDPLKRASNIWGGSVWNSGGDCMIWTIQLEHEELPSGTFRFMHVSSNCLCIYEGEDFRALENLDVGLDEQMLIYQF